MPAPGHRAISHRRHPALTSMFGPSSRADEGGYGNSENGKVPRMVLPSSYSLTKNFHFFQKHDVLKKKFRIGRVHTDFVAKHRRAYYMGAVSASTREDC